MFLLDISIQYRVIIGISAMVLLFSSFLISFITSHRKKLRYHKELQAIQEAQQKSLTEQNALLEGRVAERTNELNTQKDNLQKALTDLKMSQLQLIQKEKMASLGELTAGVAHEIQNPLNFVINFASINAELVDEIKQKFSGHQLPGDLTKDIGPMLEDLSGNVTKILQHGKRADGIVKSMLQHSRKQTGELELADLNALAKEYLNLSYFGFRSKNRHFNCILNTVLDEHLEKISIVPQDIGSLLMNLFHNSFYSVSEKKELAGNEFEPTVSLTTKLVGKTAVIVVRDNGLGISQKYLDKIFNPFFTTKPTGEGTGLGLSLCYDIVKAHQGTLTVQSVEGEFAEFTVVLNY